MRPEDCNTMDALRQQIDALDDELIILLARRSRYIDHAVALKTKENLPPRTTDRVAAVLKRVRAGASALDLDEDLVTDLWTTIIEWGIAREARAMNVRDLD